MKEVKTDYRNERTVYEIYRKQETTIGTGEKRKGEVQTRSKTGLSTFTAHL